MDVSQLATIFFNHKHSGSHPDARRLNIRQIIGAAGSVATVMISPNGTRYTLGVDDDGALTTELFAKAASYFFASPNGEKFLISVDTDGVPTTEPYDGVYGSYSFVSLIVLTDSLGNDFNMEVLDDGTIITTAL